MILSSSVRTYLANVGINQEKADEVAQSISKEIDSKNIKILDVVINLKDEFTSEDEKKRQKSLNCLSNVLGNLSVDTLKPNELNVIFRFYESKIDELQNMTEVLSGFKCLIKMHSSNLLELSKLLNIISNDYDPAKFLTSTRYQTFLILKNIFEKFGSEMKEDPSLLDLYVGSFLHIATGEKDPRNLLISFQLNKNITTTFENIDKFAEDLFDVLFCYFPITFKPPKNDPYKISSEDLKSALRSAISSTPLFANDAFSNLTDKLKASSVAVKSDTLQTLNDCVKNFGAKYCIKEYIPLWNALKFELMRNNEGGDAGLVNVMPTSDILQPDASNYQLAINIIRSLAKILSEFDMNPFNKFFSHILEELKPNFKFNKDLKQSSTILSALGSVNVQTFDVVIKESLPLFLHNSSETNQLKLIIMNLSFFFDSYIAIYGNADKDSGSFGVINSSLSSYKDEILMVMSKALTGSSENEVTLRTLSIIQFTKLIKMRGYLSEEEVSLIVQYISETILEDHNKNIYYACLEGLKVISDIYESTVYEISLKKMLDLLPNNINEQIILNEDKKIEKELILKIILDYTTSRHSLVKESIFGISDKLCTIAPIENSNEYCFTLITSLYTLFENNSTLIKGREGFLIKSEIESKLVKTLFGNSSIMNDVHNLALLSTVLFYINLNSSRTIHQAALDEYNNSFINEYDIFASPKPLVVPYVKLISGLDKDSTFKDCKKYYLACQTLLSQNGQTINQFTKLGYLEFLMVLSNKWIDEVVVDEFANFNDLSPANLEMLTWITKGLAMKNSQLSTSYLEKFISVLDNERIGPFVSRLFEIFVVDLGSFHVNKGASWSNNVKMLYKQKFFNHVFPVIVSKYKLASDISTKSNYLTALSLILKHIPNVLLDLVMEELIPMLLQALSMNNSDVIISSLETLNEICGKNSVLTTEYFHSLIPLLLKLIKKSSTNNVKVRLLTMQLLQLIASNVPINYTQAVKKDILTALIPTLDDPKRIIRKQAVDTRQVYFEIGQAPGS